LPAKYTPLSSYNKSAATFKSIPIA